MADQQNTNANKIIPQEKIEMWREESMYFKEEAPQEDSFLSEAWYWFKNLINDFFEGLLGPVLNEYVLEFLYYLLIVIGIVFLLYVIFKNKISKNIQKSTRLTPNDFQPENIESVDLEGLLAEALKQKNYKLSIRFMFLIALQNMDRKEMIVWDKYKTNMEYYWEIPKSKLQQPYNDLRLLYEQIWYGKKNANELLMMQYKEQLNQFNQLLQS